MLARFIPTRVGNTALPASTPAHRAVHPTRVGNTAWAACCSGRCTVHPHAGGEHDRRKSPFAISYGSSPRGWGTHRLRLTMAHSRRFIPTRVGNTAGVRSSSATSTVHPHAGGEHGLTTDQNEKTYGSSPRGWGTPVQVGPVKPADRFIPTRVGNTCTWSGTSGISPVHPHAGGEHAKVCDDARAAVGSSPRGWGTPLQLLARVAERRFIPTRVGNTAARPRPGCGASVHPHAGGEHILANRRIDRNDGSSPRGWGTRHAGPD